jgi:hypothetical protein
MCLRQTPQDALYHVRFVNKRGLEGVIVKRRDSESPIVSSRAECVLCDKGHGC